MSHIDEAGALFLKGCNCAQAVIAAIAPEYGLEQETCVKIAAAFGGGIARQGQMCGAVTGALMVIGLLHARSPIEDPSAKADLYMIAQQFLLRFATRHGSTTCKTLLGCDISTPEGLEQSRQQNLHTTVCLELVKSAAEMLDDFLV